MVADANDEDELTIALLKALRGAREREEKLKDVLTRATDAILSLGTTVGKMNATADELRLAVTQLTSAAGRLEQHLDALRLVPS